MSYGYNPNWSGQRQAAPFNPNYNNRGNFQPSYQNREGIKRKHSGSKSGVDKNGQIYVRGWNYSKSRGMVTFYATSYKGTKEHKSKSGRVWLNWMVKIQIQRTMEERIVSGLYDQMTRRVIIRDLSMVMNPSKDYCGTFIRRKNR